MDADALEQSRVMSFMTYQEAATIRGWGIDLQLYTHRHHLPSTDCRWRLRTATLNTIAAKAICC